MQKQIKNIKNKIFVAVVILVCTLFTGLSIHALASYFAKQKREPIILMNNVPIFDVERTGGNNNDKTLLPIQIPNLNVKKYQHLITVDHKATFNPNGVELGDDLLYLKIKSSYDTKKTFDNPEKYFVLSIKVAGLEYDDTKRPAMTIKNQTGETYHTINISVQQINLIKEKNPQLDLIIDYELVDSQGKAFGGGSQTINNKIVQTA